MNNPFVIHEDSIEDRALKDTPKRQWVETTQPVPSREIEYLKAAMKNTRLRVVFILSLVILFAFSGRSAQLQVISGKEYRVAAETNRVRIIRIPAPRGAIVDRNGVALTANIPRFRVVLNPLDVPKDPQKRTEAIERISKIVNIPADELASALRIVRLPISPFLLKDALTLEEVYPLLIAVQDIPGVAVEPISLRSYTKGEDFSHILGYLGKISEPDKNFYISSGYSLDDVVGKSGLELAYEESLHGRDGKKYLEVDAKGQTQKVIAESEAIAGRTLVLGLDAELQQETARALKEQLIQLSKRRGVAIVLDPKSGEIRAMVSLPSFDNNILNTPRQDPEALKSIFGNPDRPLFPRAFAGTYPSGSSIKPAIAASALQEKIITANSSYLSVGGLRIGQWFFPDWKAGGHGSANVTRAIAESINTFFYIIGGGYDNYQGLGIDRLAKYLSAFGFGSTTGLELRGEASGLVPTPQWKQEHKSEQWYIGDTYHLSIGQGDFLVTPLQIARMTAYFASGGIWTQPHLVARENVIENPADGPQIEQGHINTVRQGMREAVLYGSARSLLSLPISSAGKTGTAQWSDVYDTHAWFTGFAPYDRPEVVVTILIEEGGEGSSAALPVAKNIIRWWYENRVIPKRT